MVLLLFNQQDNNIQQGNRSRLTCLYLDINSQLDIEDKLLMQSEDCKCLLHKVYK